MSEKYTKIFSLPENLYAEGAPVIIMAGALLKDNGNGRIIAQLKLKNISQNVINGVKLNITSYDAFEVKLGEPYEFQMVDFYEKRDMTFGQKIPIELPDTLTRSIGVVVEAVAFSDGSMWKSNGEIWEPLQQQKTLESVLQDQELKKQYQIEYGRNAEYWLSKQKDLWICPCGEINRLGEETCHICGKPLHRIECIEREELQEACDVRLKQERCEEEQRKAEAEKEAIQREKNRTKGRKVIIIATLCIAILIALSLLDNM